MCRHQIEDKEELRIHELSECFIDIPQHISNTGVYVNTNGESGRSFN